MVKKKHKTQKTFVVMNPRLVSRLEQMGKNIKQARRDERLPKARKIRDGQ